MPIPFATFYQGGKFDCQRPVVRGLESWDGSAIALGAIVGVSTPIAGFYGIRPCARNGDANCAIGIGIVIAAYTLGGINYHDVETFNTIMTVGPLPAAPVSLGNYLKFSVAGGWVTCAADDPDASVVALGANTPTGGAPFASSVIAVGLSSSGYSNQNGIGRYLGGNPTLIGAPAAASPGDDMTARYAWQPFATLDLPAASPEWLIIAQPIPVGVAKATAPATGAVILGPMTYVKAAGVAVDISDCKPTVSCLAAITDDTIVGAAGIYAQLVIMPSRIYF